ncbi:hypothetical protein DB31_5683 [Hyalangium minutum]|uniref:Uncharacterized protein n=1 Tax=Hyalangium minutum TaxID=394096 RepID=A0A085WSH8_9BACT|nr:hypothetical protein DB31_5683 [Hyalangium minutum]
MAFLDAPRRLPNRPSVDSRGSGGGVPSQVMACVGTPCMRGPDDPPSRG